MSNQAGALPARPEAARAGNPLTDFPQRGSLTLPTVAVRASSRLVGAACGLLDSEGQRR
jgi:hypothetical protein